MLRIHKGCHRQGHKASLAGKQTLRLTFDFALKPLGAKADGGLCCPCVTGALWSREQLYLRAQIIQGMGSHL